VRRFSPVVWALLALLWAILICLLLTLDSAPVPTLAGRWFPGAVLPYGIDKAGHAALFLVQAFLCTRAAEPRLGLRRALLLAVTFCVALGAVTELRQRTLPHRDADPADLAADAVGALAAAAAVPLSRRWSRARAPARA